MRGDTRGVGGCGGLPAPRDVEAATNGDETLDADAFHAYLQASLARYPASYAERVVAHVPPADAYHYVFVPTARRVQGALYAVLSATPTEESCELLRRLSALYDHAYVRARDLQRADVYARAAWPSGRARSPRAGWPRRRTRRPTRWR